MVTKKQTKIKKFSRNGKNSLKKQPKNYVAYLTYDIW